MNIKYALVTVLITCSIALASQAVQRVTYVVYQNPVYWSKFVTLYQFLYACASGTTYAEYSLSCRAILRSSVKLKQPITVFLPTNESLEVTHGANPIDINAFARAHIAKDWPKQLPTHFPAYYELFKYYSNTLNGAKVHIQYLKPQRSNVLYPNYFSSFPIYRDIPVNFEPPVNSDSNDYVLLGNLDYVYGYGIVHVGNVAAKTLPTWTGAMCCTQLTQGYVYLLDQPLPF